MVSENEYYCNPFNQGKGMGVNQGKDRGKPLYGISVDCGSVNGKNPGIFEYRLVDIATREVILNYVIPGTTTNNIAEFLALVEGLKFVYDQPTVKVYSDSKTALAWVRDKKVKTAHQVEDKDQQLKIRQALFFLNTQKYQQPIFWINKQYGEIPADYGRK